MLGLGKPKPVAEYEATGEIERVYHEIRQTMRVSGINLNFRTWASFEQFFPAIWDAMRPNVETLAFEEAAAEVRNAAVQQAMGWSSLTAKEASHLGESQCYQVQAALALYHYINPKLLVFTSAVTMALEGEEIGGRNGANSQKIERGIPAKMYPMEMEADEPEDKRLRELFEDIKQTLDLDSINSDYRTLALWPDYLEAAWRSLKPITQQSDFRAASESLLVSSRQLAKALPCKVELSRQQVEELGEDAAKVLQTSQHFEQLLPSLILNIALLSREWQTPDALQRSPFPARTATEAKLPGGAR